jgi:uncharacterized membrane protein YcfT
MAEVPREDWVDYAKGICIIMVVMMHSTLGVEAASGREGFMHLVVAFAKPFRMPDFFLISGLFLSRVINRDWRTYLDRKVVHFTYFYVLWTAIQFAYKGPSFAAEQGWAHVGAMYLESFIEPFGTLWFIYLLPIFFVVTKLTRSAPPVPIWAIAAALEMLHISTGWTAIDEFAARFVYFYSGYLFAGYVFAMSARVRKHNEAAIAGLAIWGTANAAIVNAGFSEWPLISLALGFSGACAIIVIGTLLAQARWLSILRYCGRHSIIIYLAFCVPMAAARVALFKTGLVTDIGAMSLVVTAVGVSGALAMGWLARTAGLNFLFERPAAFRIAPARLRPMLQAAE